MSIYDTVERRTSEKLPMITGQFSSLPEWIEDYVGTVSEGEDVMGVYFGLRGTDVNLVVVKEGEVSFDNDELLEGAESRLRERYIAGVVDSRVIYAQDRSLEEIESEGEHFSAFMDDIYSGQHVERLFPEVATSST